MTNEELQRIFNPDLRALAYAAYKADLRPATPMRQQTHEPEVQPTDKWVTSPNWHRSDVGIFGRRLQVGETIQEGDRYDSIDGNWKPTGPFMVGKLIGEGTADIWVRPG